MHEATQLLTRFLDSSGYEVPLAYCVWHSIGPVPPADCPHSAAAAAVLAGAHRGRNWLTQKGHVAVFLNDTPLV